ncbi:YbjN domain-containing protein [Thermogemmatispora onikobensis]|uniref:YbjN domain-containing protein n=1 Tax=Thermogemmatispora onikobensis TaxID=732234 RepID=UPI0008532EE1|nr:YbjN domain-containing protein [Thermogemmatispora onikobensis]
MSEDFRITDVVSYLTRLGLRVASVDERQGVAELVFHDELGQWQLLLILQAGSPLGRRLLFIVPHLSILPQRQRLSCLEALMSLNYTLPLGRFGLDLEDDEVRFCASVYLGQQRLSLPAFRHHLEAVIQTIVIYHSLLPRIIYGHCTARAALTACEQAFLESYEGERLSWQEGPSSRQELAEDEMELDASSSELDAAEVLAEIRRMLQEGRSRERDDDPD